MNAEFTQEIANVLKYAFYSGEDVEHCIEELKRAFGPDVLVNYPYEVEEAFEATGMGNEYRAFTAHGKEGVIRSSLDEGRKTMGKLLKERWGRLAFSKGTQTLNESDRFYDRMDMELWRVGDYTDARDEGFLERIKNNDFDEADLRMKCEQLREEIEDELENMDDPQNQYDQAVALKEALLNFIEDHLRDEYP